MTTVRALLSEGARILGASPEARREAVLLLGHSLDAAEARLIAHAEDAVDPAQETAFRRLLARRASGEPVAYLTGSRGFYDLELRVTPAVLIPRPATELLVELALARIPPDAACAVADLGTGSGAIALALAHARPRAAVTATDASASALDVAADNAVRLGLHNVTFVPGDWCVALGDTRFDLIVSNPPYVAAGDPHLMRGDLRFEPAAALVAGADGLDAIRAIAAGARRHLRQGAWLLLEHGFDQGEAVRGLLAGHGFDGVFTARDLEGHDRVGGGWRG